MERRTLIRLLVAFGIGIPLLIEGFTFLGLLEAQLLGGGGGSTPSVDGATQGEEGLRSTAPTETLSTTSLTEDGTLTLTVTINNTANTAYELRLTEVTTLDGEGVAGNGSSGVIESGERGSVTEQWSLPAGATPESVTVITITDPDGDAERTERSIALGEL